MGAFQVLRVFGHILGCMFTHFVLFNFIGWPLVVLAAGNLHFESSLTLMSAICFVLAASGYSMWRFVTPVGASDSSKALSLAALTLLLLTLLLFGVVEIEGTLTSLVLFLLSGLIILQLAREERWSTQVRAFECPW